jgi:hypothetical protein
MKSRRTGDRNRETIHKVVVGQLRTTIRAHGPINAILIGSAAKRIAGGIMGYISSDGTVGTNPAPDLQPEVDKLRAECSAKDEVIRGLRARLEGQKPSVQQPKPPERPRVRRRSRRHRRHRAANVRLPELGQAHPPALEPAAPLNQVPL